VLSLKLQNLKEYPLAKRSDNSDLHIVIEMWLHTS